MEIGDSQRRDLDDVLIYSAAGYQVNETLVTRYIA